MTPRSLLRLSLSLSLFCIAPAALAKGPAAPSHLRVEYLDRPLGLDVAKPRFYWWVGDDRRGAHQVAYQVQVAVTEAELRSGHVEMWNSRRVGTDQSAHVRYAGRPLSPRQRYWWRVRTWNTANGDASGTPSPWSAPTFWETGQMGEAWKAKWIGVPMTVSSLTEPLRDVKWIWYPEADPTKDPPNETRYFRTVVDIPAGREVKSATLYLAVDNELTAWINDKPAGQASGWFTFGVNPVGELLHPGRNVLAIAAKNSGGPAGVAAILRVNFADGTMRTITQREGWRSSEREAAGWRSAAFDDAGWKPVAVIHSMGEAPWNTPSINPQYETVAHQLRKEFTATKPVKSARLYITALGSYRASVNGVRAGNDLLTPDWTDYRKRVTYQAYDVTSAVKPGANALGVTLGDGWYGSGLGWNLEKFNFGPAPDRLLAELHVRYADGSELVVPTDASWRASESPILRSEIYAGETYDARREQAGWDRPGFRAVGWTAATVMPPKSAPKITCQRSETIQVEQTLTPKSISQPSPGAYVYDMGQNMVGWVRLTAAGPAGTRIRLRFAEKLQPNGQIYTENLRKAEATDTFALKGAGSEQFEPTFTYHGFRYVEVTGFPGTPTLQTLRGVVFHSAMPFTGQFACSSPLVNQLQHNILWGQRSNHHSVPTDCPQRDERLGWMGDAEIFSRTACYNMEMAAFYAKWMRDVVDAQSAQGAFSDVSPRVIDPADGAPAWGDAGVIVPYEVFRQYGDADIIEENWAPMERWMEYIGSANPNFLWLKRRNNDFGDWVPAESDTPKEVIATAYWAYDAELMAKMAEATGRDAAARKYRQLYASIKDAFVKAFVKPDGTVGNGSQTCQALAIHMGLLPKSSPGLPNVTPREGSAAVRLAEDIHKRRDHLSTGFVGTTYLMRSLSMAGLDKLAYTLLLNDTYPSWGYTIRKGATTMWERWNGDTGDPAMNSYNHYAFGAVGEWLYRYVLGIDTAPGAAYSQIIIRPVLDPRLTWAKGEYQSIYGPIRSSWRTAGNRVTLDVTIPPNTTATVFVHGSRVTEGGKPIAPATNIKQVQGGAGYSAFTVGAGTYHFEAVR